jgi:hypothetical protein
MTNFDEERPEESAAQEDEGPDPEDLDEDPAYNPEDPALKDIKGG